MFTLRDVDDGGDITYEDPRYRADYWYRHTARALPGHTIRGGIVGAKGRAVLHAHTSARGPRALAAADGSFVLRGASPNDLWTVYADFATTAFHGRDYAPDLPVVLHLAPPPEPPNAEFRIRLRGAMSARVHFDRARDGRRFSFDVVDGDAVRLPEGGYRLTAGGPFAPWVAGPVDVDVPGAATLTGRAQPRLEITGDAAAVRRVVAGVHDAAAPTHVPATGDVFVLADPLASFRAGPVRDGVRTAHVDRPLKSVRFPDLDFTATLQLLDAPEERGDADVPAVFTRASGDVAVFVAVPDRGWAIVPVTLPDRGAVHVRDLAFREPPRARTLRVLGPEDAWVDVLWEERPPEVDHYAGAEEIAPGVFRDVLFRDGAWVRVVSATHGERRVRLRGDGPYEVRFGSSAVDVTFPDGELGVVLCNGREIRAEDGVARLRGLEPGAHELVVGVDGRHGGTVHRVVLRPGETRALAVR